MNRFVDFSGSFILKEILCFNEALLKIWMDEGMAGICNMEIHLHDILFCFWSYCCRLEQISFFMLKSIIKETSEPMLNFRGKRSLNYDLIDLSCNIHMIHMIGFCLNCCDDGYVNSSKTDALSRLDFIQKPLVAKPKLLLVSAS
jgi:hypothetical protein